MRIECVTVDCADPVAVATFWNDALGWGGVAAHPETLDDFDREMERLEALGASFAWEEEFPPEIAKTYRNVVLRDVGGNEFCLSGGTIPEGTAI